MSTPLLGVVHRLVVTQFMFHSVINKKDQTNTHNNLTYILSDKMANYFYESSTLAFILMPAPLLRLVHHVVVTQ